MPDHPEETSQVPFATRPGDLLGDRYQLVDLLTESDGGRFWRAYDRVLERHVAIHVIRGDDERAPSLMEAARRSATVLDRRVLRVLDAECTDEACYVVNEWGWGTSLDIVAAGTGALGPRRAAWLVAEVADSVAVAHAAGVTHGRLNPENVLVDRAGGVRIIGLCVDAALHGLAGPDDPDRPTPGEVQRDLDDLAGLLYCALTGRWAGASASLVPGAPRDHGQVLRPRQVRAGIPRSLDLLCEELLHRPSVSRHRELDDVVSSARGIADHLAEFVGDPTGMPAALLASIPDVLPEAEQVVLPPVPEVLPHDAVAPPRSREAPEPPEPVTTATPAVEDRPTEAGVPIFGDDDDVSWLERRTTPAPPPPPFEAPPERPLFAPAPAAGAPPRTPRQGQAGRSRSAGGGNDQFWPWDTGTGASTSSTSLVAIDDDEPVPGRGFLRLGVVLAALVLLAVAVVVAVKLSSGGSGGPGDDATDAPSSAAPGGQGRQVRGPVIDGVEAAAFDPQGDPSSENDEDAPLAVDGDPATSWSTEGYNDQLGPPPGLKLGVGLVLDLGDAQAVGQVSLSFVGTPTSVSLFVTDGRPDTVDGLDPVAQGSADGPRLTLDAGGARGTHVVLWLTALPVGDDGRFRGAVAEVVVRAVPDE